YASPSAHSSLTAPEFSHLKSTAFQGRITLFLTMLHVNCYCDIRRARPMSRFLVSAAHDLDPQSFHPQHRRSGMERIPEPFRRRAVEAAGDAGDRGLQASRPSNLDVPADGARGLP